MIGFQQFICPVSSGYYHSCLSSAAIQRLQRRKDGNGWRMEADVPVTRSSPAGEDSGKKLMPAWLITKGRINIRMDMESVESPRLLGSSIKFLSGC